MALLDALIMDLVLVAYIANFTPKANPGSNTALEKPFPNVDVIRGRSILDGKVMDPHARNTYNLFKLYTGSESVMGENFKHALDKRSQFHSMDGFPGNDKIEKDHVSLEKQHVSVREVSKQSETDNDMTVKNTADRKMWIQEKLGYDFTAPAEQEFRTINYLGEENNGENVLRISKKQNNKTGKTHVALSGTQTPVLMDRINNYDFIPITSTNYQGNRAIMETASSKRQENGASNRRVVIAKRDAAVNQQRGRKNKQKNMANKSGQKGNAKSTKKIFVKTVPTGIGVVWKYTHPRRYHKGRTNNIASRQNSNIRKRQPVPNTIDKFRKIHHVPSTYQQMKKTFHPTNQDHRMRENFNVPGSVKRGWKCHLLLCTEDGVRKNKHSPGTGDKKKKFYHVSSKVFTVRENQPNVVDYSVTNNHVPGTYFKGMENHRIPSTIDKVRKFYQIMSTGNKGRKEQHIPNNIGKNKHVPRIVSNVKTFPHTPNTVEKRMGNHHTANIVDNVTENHHIPNTVDNAIENHQLPNTVDKVIKNHHILNTVDKVMEYHPTPLSIK